MMAQPIVNLDKLAEAQEAADAAVEAAQIAAEKVAAVLAIADPGEPVVRLSVDLPESLHHRLKLLCVHKRIKMAEHVRGLIEQDLETA